MSDSYTAFDIETTGLNPAFDHIIEIGAVKIKDGKVVEKFSRLINPHIKLPASIIKLTGIHDNMLADESDIQDVIHEFLDFTEDEILIGHNIMFDYSFIKTAASKIKRKFERYGIDTLKLSRAFHKELKNRSLENMCVHYNIRNEEAHRAFSDAQAAYELFDRIRQKYKTESPDLFCPEILEYKVKKQAPITQKQKNYLNDLIKYHKIEVKQSISDLTKSEASKIIDRIILEHGRIF